MNNKQELKERMIKTFDQLSDTILNEDAELVGASYNDGDTEISVLVSIGKRGDQIKIRKLILEMYGKKPE